MVAEIALISVWTLPMDHIVNIVEVLEVPWVELVMVPRLEGEHGMHMDLEHFAVIASTYMDLMAVVAFLLVEGEGWFVVLKMLTLKLKEMGRIDSPAEAQRAAHYTEKNRVGLLDGDSLQLE